MNIAVCEDNAVDCEIICGYITRYCEENQYIGQIHKFTSGEALLYTFTPGAYEIIFMVGMNGFDTAHKIREADRNCEFVFITTSEEFALKSFSVIAASYVLKPIRDEAIAVAFEACEKQFYKHSRFIEVMADYQSVKIPLNMIQYIEVYAKASLFHLEANAEHFTKVVKTNMPLSVIEEKLGGKPFLRCHRCYLVNLNYMDDMRGKDLLMKNGYVIPIRINGRKEIRNAVASFITGGFFKEDAYAKADL